MAIELVGAVGVEPTTNGLKGRCSTTELRSCTAQTYYKKTIRDAYELAKTEFSCTRHSGKCVWKVSATLRFESTE